MKVNPNTSEFWSEKVSALDDIPREDMITKDRIRIITRKIRSNSRLLDVGVGYGFLEDSLVSFQKNIDLHGIDITQVGLEKILGRVQGKFIVGNSTNQPYRSKSFDYVCLLEVLEHLDFTDSKRTLLESRRVLTDSGMLIVSVPLFDKVFAKHPSGHVREYNPQKLFLELTETGFRIEERKYLFAFSFLYKLKTVVNRIIKVRKPNNLIVFARKK